MAELEERLWYREVDRSQWLALAGAWMGWALDAMDFLLITLVLTEIARDLNLDLTTAGTLIFATFATRWLGGALFGSIADRYGRKRGMMLSILTYSVATFLCGLSWSYWSLLAFRLIVGLGMAGEYGTGCTLLMESWPEKVRNKASGFLVSGYSFGGLLASLAYLTIEPAFGWRGLFFFGLAPAVLALFIRFFVRESEEWRGARTQASASQTPFVKLFSGRWLATTVVITIFLFSASGMNYPILALLPTYLKVIGYEPKAVGTIMSIANIGGLVGFCASGFFADWFGLRRAVTLSLLVSLAFLAMAFLVGQSSVLLVGTLMFLLLFTNLGITGLWPKYVTHYFAPDVRSTGLGVTYNIGSLAGGISPVLGASLQNVFGLGGAIALLTTFWTVIVIFIVAFNLPERVSIRASRRFGPVSGELTSERA